ncbi:MAG: hypothetical protein H0W90_06610 [Actinobacteria bacterium]|nr:hypothetical protein [Actinomycetota bacterium]
MRADLPTGTVTFIFTDVEGSTFDKAWREGQRLTVDEAVTFALAIS